MENVTTKDGLIVGGLVGIVIDLLRGRRVARAERSLKVLETLQLGGRRQLLLVRCGQLQFLVGTGADEVQTIVPITADEVQP